jgi:hypothetical protein
MDEPITYPQIDFPNKLAAAAFTYPDPEILL